MPRFATPAGLRGSISRRLMASFLVVALSTVAIGIVGTVELSGLDHKASDIYTRGALPAEKVRSMEGTWFHYTTDLTSQGAAQYFTAAQLKGIVADAAAQTTKLNTDLAAAQAMALQPEAAKALQTLASQLKIYYDNTNNYNAVAATKDQVKIRALLDQNQAIQNQVPTLLTTAADAQLAGAATQARTAHDAYKTARTLIIALLLIGTALSIALAIRTSRSITRPLRHTEEILNRLAQGDLTARVKVTGTDEVARMGTSLNTSLDSVAEVIRLISSSAAQLSTASGELNTVARTITDSADTAATQAAAVAKSAEEVSANVATVATGTDEMSLSIREISVNAAEAAAVAADAMAVAEETTQTVTKLGDSSVEIGNVIKVITSIAAQTNLLALNATIEAARAGEAGKGFAVVANEVKELAQETARATEDIGRRVAAIQSDTAGAVEAIGRISGVIERVHGFQTTIASAVEEQNATTNEMGRNVGQAAETSANIAHGISSVAAAAEASSNGAKASQDAARDLAAMSDELRAAISHFHS